MAKISTIKCPHCSGTGRCNCGRCQLKNYGTSNTGRLAICYKCSGSGKVVVFG